jgi:formylglycine-generating enzyme required for sulfatase activity
LAEAERWAVPVAWENELGMKFVLIPAGTFEMGSSKEPRFPVYPEIAHKVTLSRPFYLQATEVTNAQYRAFDPTHDSGSAEGLSLNGDEQPVVEVTWEAATQFARWLSQVDSRHYRLPTEAEWERGARGGSTTAYWWGDAQEGGEAFANFCDVLMHSGFRHEGTPRWDVQASCWPVGDGNVVTGSVGSYKPNPFGLSDVLGNASEWCADWHSIYSEEPVVDPTGPESGAFRIIRGGAWATRPCRTYLRSQAPPTHTGRGLGFRVAADIE